MQNAFLTGIIAAIAILAIGTLMKHSGRKSCCGSSGDYKPRKKKLNNVIAKKVFVVQGMHCEKCSNRITEVVNDIPGVAAAVDLKKGIVTVSYEQAVPDVQIQTKIERVGYTVKEIR